MSATVSIGQNNYFGFGFTTLALYSNIIVERQNISIFEALYRAKRKKVPLNLNLNEFCPKIQMLWNFVLFNESSRRTLREISYKNSLSSL